jgi:MFS transporter, SHS family, lactate transporter
VVETVSTASPAADPPWYREVTAVQWRGFFATFFGWVLDGFDFTILTFVLIDIQKTFAVDAFLAGILGTVTLVMRLIGGALAGAAADRWGRKIPLMISIVWFSLFAGLSGFASSYTMLFALRALFGIGMGGEWAAGMPLTLEHWPSRLRGVASGLLQGGFGWGYILSALAFTFWYPRLESSGDLAWRSMLWLGIVPALMVLWIRIRVEESPVWLDRQRYIKDSHLRERLSLLRIFQRDILLTTIQTSLLMAAFMFSFYSLTFWYATFLREAGRPTLPYIVVFNAAAIVGSYFCGHASETRLGRRGAATVAACIAITVLPLYLFAHDAWLLGLGALLIGASGVGMWGIVPTYLVERFPTAVRSVGAGFAYHTGAALGSFTPAIVGGLRDSGWSLAEAMTMCIAGALILTVGILWAGPETRGRRFV